MNYRFKYLILICIVLSLAGMACKRAALEVAGVLFATADDFLENRPEGTVCNSDFSENTLNTSGELTFNQEHLLCVNVQLDSLDFEAMRYESRFGPSVRHRNGATVIAVFFEHFRQCDVPWPSEFNWYKGSIEIDGREVEQVGLRKKGFLGSIFSPAPSMRIQTDRHVNGQSFGATKSITLNNNSEDPTRIRSSLNFLIFERAGYPAPRCNLANVSINGEAFGAYSHLEAVDEAFLRRAFGTASGDLSYRIPGFKKYEWHFSLCQMCGSGQAYGSAPKNSNRQFFMYHFLNLY